MATQMTKLKEADKAITQNAADFQKDEPEAFKKTQKLLDALKRTAPGAAPSDEVKKLATELLQWQFDAQLEVYQREHEAVKQRAAQTGNAATAKMAQALAETVAFLTEAKAAGMPPSAAAAASLQARLPKLQKAYDEAASAAAHSTINIPMRALKKPIVSSSGVALKAVQPPPRAAAAGAAMMSLLQPAAPPPVTKPAAKPPSKPAARAATAKPPKKKK